MTKDIRQKLSPFETQLRCAKDANFIRMSMDEFDVLAEAYKEMYGVALTKNEMNCSTCKLRAVKRLAEDYFNSKPGRPKKLQ